MVKILRVAICLMLIVCILAMSLSVFADNEPEPTPTVPPQLDPENPVTLQLEMASMYVWKMLDSWGIKVDVTNWLNGTDDVLAWVKQMMIDYAVDVGVTVGQWIAPWLFNEDIWGNLMANDRALNDVEDFANWLIAKFSLSDNQNKTIIAEGSTISDGGYVIYKLPITLVSQNTSNRMEFTRITADANAYVLFRKISDSYGNVQNDFMALSETYGTQITSQVINNSTGSAGTLYTNTCTNSNSNGTIYYSWAVYSFFSHSNNYPGNGYPLTGYQVYSDSKQTIQNNLNGKVIQSVDTGVSIITGVIYLPDDSPDYTEGDSLIIIDGEPQYQIVDWSEVTVDNLPAVITRNSIPDIGNDLENPGFSVPWQAINGLIQYVAAPAGAIMAMVNEAPVEGVIMLYALIGGILIFGMIRIMREH